MTEQEKKNILDISGKIFHTANINFNEVQRLGGLTNHNYKITVNGEDYVFRMPGEGTSDMINRSDEHISTQLANEVAVDIDLLYFDDNTGIKVSKFIKSAETMSPDTMKKSENLKLAAGVFNKLHSCKRNTRIKFDVFHMIENYESIIKKRKGSFYSDYYEIRKKVYGYKAEMDKLGIQNVPCHNDPLCENFIKSMDTMYLIDWEYAGMNDPIWDLADLSIEAGLNPEQEGILLKAYSGHTPDHTLIRRLWINKIYLDFLWSLWGKVRSMYSSNLEHYARNRYDRAKNNIKLLEEIR